jgi:hypothetical protein
MIFLISLVIPYCCGGRLPERENEGMVFFLHYIPKFRFYD